MQNKIYPVFKQNLPKTNTSAKDIVRYIFCWLHTYDSSNEVCYNHLRLLKCCGSFYCETEIDKLASMLVVPAFVVLMLQSKSRYDILLIFE